MQLQLVSVLLAIAFILPGFLTSKLISARTPKRWREASTFEDTADSLLRSAYISLILGLVALAIYHTVIRTRLPTYATDLEGAGVAAFAAKYPLLSLETSLLWLIAAFALAFLFGARWDPLHAIMLRLSAGIGGLSQDLVTQLRQAAITRRKTTSLPSRLWLRVRMKNGATYRGEFVSSTFRENGQGREILITNSFFVPPAPDSRGAATEERLDFVLLDTANAESIEVRFSDLPLR